MFLQHYYRIRRRFSPAIPFSVLAELTIRCLFEVSFKCLNEPLNLAYQRWFPNSLRKSAKYPQHGSSPPDFNLEGCSLPNVMSQDLVGNQIKAWRIAPRILDPTAPLPRTLQKLTVFLSVLRSCTHSFCFVYRTSHSFTSICFWFHSPYFPKCVWHSFLPFLPLASQLSSEMQASPNSPTPSHFPPLSILFKPHTGQAFLITDELRLPSLRTENLHISPTLTPPSKM